MSITLKFKSFYVFLALFFFLFQCAFSQSVLADFDTIRAELYLIKDKNSPVYQKTKKKLDKYINQNKVNYSLNARFDDIERLILEQKFSAAEYELFDLIEFDIQTSRCYELLGDIYFKKQNYKEASRYYKISKQHDEDNISAMYKHAKLYISQNRNLLAIELLKEIAQKTDDENLINEIEQIVSSKIKPLNRFEANILYEILAIIYTKQGKIDQTYFALDRALNLNPTDTFLKYWLGDLFLQNQDNKNALLVYDSILADIPYDTQIRNSKAKAFIADGNLASAKKEYLQVLEVVPNSLQARYGLYKIYQNKLSADEIILKVYPEKKNLKLTKEDYLSFAKFLEDMEDIEGAKFFKDCADKLAKKQNPPTISKKENEKVALKKEQPKKQIQKPVQKESQKEKATSKETLKPQQEKQTKKEEKPVALKSGKEKYQKTLDNYFNIEPKTPEIYIAIANTYKLAGENNLAMKYFEEAKKMNPTNPDIYYHIGLINLENNNTQKAKEFLEKSINLSSGDNLKAKNLLNFVNQKIVTEKINLAYAKYEKKEYIDGLNILDKAIKQYPKNSQLYYYRALIYIAMNRNAGAIIDLQKAVELDYGNYMAYYQLGKTYEKIKDEKSALVSYERFLSIEPDEKDLTSEVQKKVLSLGEKYY